MKIKEQKHLWHNKNVDSQPLYLVWKNNEETEWENIIKINVILCVILCCK